MSNRAQSDGGTLAYDAGMDEEERAEEREQLLPAVLQAVEKVGLEERDVALTMLIRRYARLMDNAVAERRYAKALRLLSAFVDKHLADEIPARANELQTAWDLVAAAVAEHSAVSDLGPKLLAGLTSAGLTPAGRKALESKRGGGGKVEPLPSPLQKLRDEARQQRERQRNAASGT